MKPSAQKTTNAFQRAAAKPVTLREKREIFFRALQDGDLETTEKMIKRYPSAVNWKDDTKKRALHYAVLLTGESYRNFLLQLLDHNIEIDAVNIYGNTALHYAATDSRLENAALLIARGANPLLRNNRGKTACEDAQQTEEPKAAALLQTAEAEYIERKKVARKKAFAVFTEGLPHDLRTKPSPFNFKKQGSSLEAKNK